VTGATLARLKTASIGLAFWLGFNLLTGFITGDRSLNDNYFVLFLVIVYVAIKCSYTAVLANSYLTISRFGMVTVYADLYKLEKVTSSKEELNLVTKDRARYKLKIFKLPESSHVDIRNSIKPLTGERQPVPAAVVDLKTDDKRQQVISVFGMAFGLILVLESISSFSGVHLGSESFRLDAQLATLLHGLLVASLLIGNGLSQFYGKTIYQRIKRAKANTVVLIAFILFGIAVGLNESGVFNQLETPLLVNVIAISLTLTFVGLLVLAYFLKKRAEKQVGCGE
jgi:membrane protein CcdC involved in cytochrome C biogenesis